MTIKLHMPQGSPGIPPLSQFCAKTEIMLKLSGLEFTIAPEGDPRSGPKKKFPYITDGDAVIGDSSFIETHLNKSYDVDFYKDISTHDRALAQVITGVLEEQLYWVTVYSRWKMEENWPIIKGMFFGQMPPDMGEKFASVAREAAVNALWGQGMGRHTPKEVFTIGARIIQNLSTLLDDKTFFVGDKMTTVDAAAYGTLINLVQNPVPTPMRACILAEGSLCRFLDRISDFYYPNAERCAKEQKPIV